MEKLLVIRQGRIPKATLTDEHISQCLLKFPKLKEVINLAHQYYLSEEKVDLVEVQKDIMNFYAPESINPFIPLYALGPWIVTREGGIIYDSAGYGMLGLGHNPPSVLNALAEPQVMANVMTPHLLQKQFAEAMWKEIGQTRNNSKCYDQLACLNSGSESVSLAMRIIDAYAYKQTLPGAPHQYQTPIIAILRGSFHGRTELLLSNSVVDIYKKNLFSFQDACCLTINPNDITQLEFIFNKYENSKEWIVALFIEPVMGEGNPGEAINPYFYAKCRDLTWQHNSILVVDSIQAGLRCNGYLSIVDYPLFRGLPPPDIEVFSKALNAGQYPLSVLVCSKEIAKYYAIYTYGNTMTTSPRALAVGLAVLKTITLDMRKNIIHQGIYFKHKLESLKQKSNLIGKIQGCGLLLSAEINYNINSIERKMREKGIGVIHGGKNALRFTPYFNITKEEIDLIIDILEDTLRSLN
jgi:acetylornithine/succinyldiaminopimelate/putrescine aminotransferase